MRICASINSCIDGCKHTCKHKHMHMQTRAHTCTRTRTHAHAHARTHTHTPRGGCRGTNGPPAGPGGTIPGPGPMGPMGPMMPGGASIGGCGMPAIIIGPGRPGTITGAGRPTMCRRGSSTPIKLRASRGAEGVAALVHAASAC